MSTRTPSTAMGCECVKCGHVWIVAYLPMDVRDVVKLGKRAACPVCGDTKPMLAKTAKLKPLLRQGSEG